MSKMTCHCRGQSAGGIIEGHFPVSMDEAMISTELAELNNLQIGDTLQLTVAMSKAKKDLKISGVFSDATIARSNSDFYAPQFNRRNDVIASYDFFNQIPDEAMQDFKTFLLKDSLFYSRYCLFSLQAL